MRWQIASNSYGQLLESITGFLETTRQIPSTHRCGAESEAAHPVASRQAHRCPHRGSSDSTPDRPGQAWWPIGRSPDGDERLMAAHLRLHVIAGEVKVCGH